MNVAKMVGGGVRCDMLFRITESGWHKSSHLGSRASSPLTCSSQCKLKDVTELQLHNSRFTVIDAVRYKQNAGVGGKSFDARDELDDITTRGLESGRKAKRSTNRDDFIGFNISHHEEITHIGVTVVRRIYFPNVCRQHGVPVSVHDTKVQTWMFGREVDGAYIVVCWVAVEV